MKINIIGENVTATSAIQDYINKKIENAIKTESPNYMEIRIGKDNQNFYIKSLFNHQGSTVNISESANDLYAAIDSISKKINRNILKINSRKSNANQTFILSLNQT